MTTDQRPLLFVINSLKGRFFYLFAALILFLFLYPYFEASRPGDILFTLLFAAIPIAGMYAVSYNRIVLVIAIFLGVPTIIWSLEVVLQITIIPVGMGKAIGLVFYAFATLVILTNILQRKSITTDTLYGAVCVYLMLGMTWMLAYRLIDRIYPGSFVVDADHNIDGVLNMSDFVYYSFVTLTTLGYGDITPVTSQARSLAFLEAAAGTLYIAILIARMVSLYTTHAATGKE